jgi:hypothetical protein
MQVIWAGVFVVVQPSPGAGAPPAAWLGRAADHDAILNQVTAWLSGLRQGVQAAPPLPAFHFTPPAPVAPLAADESETPLPGFYL